MVPCELTHMVEVRLRLGAIERLELDQLGAQVVPSDDAARGVLDLARRARVFIDVAEAEAELATMTRKEAIT